MSIEGSRFGDIRILRGIHSFFGSAESGKRKAKKTHTYSDLRPPKTLNTIDLESEAAGYHVLQYKLRRDFRKLGFSSATRITQRVPTCFFYHLLRLVGFYLPLYIPLYCLKRYLHFVIFYILIYIYVFANYEHIIVFHNPLVSLKMI